MTHTNRLITFITSLMVMGILQGTSSSSLAPEIPARVPSAQEIQLKNVAENRGIYNPMLVKGKEYLDAEDYRAARHIFNKIVEKAKQNPTYDPWAAAEAEYRLGEMNYFGRGAKANVPEAIRLWEKVAAQHDNLAARAWSLCQLGDLYLEGIHVKRDLKKAQDYFSVALPVPKGEPELQEWIDSSLENIAKLRREKKKRPAEKAIEPETESESESDLSEKEMEAAYKLLRMRTPDEEKKEKEAEELRESPQAFKKLKPDNVEQPQVIRPAPLFDINAPD